MIRRIIPVAAVVALALSAGAAIAADSSSMSKSSSSIASANDKLSLTNAQEKSAWNSISKQATKQTAPSTFTASKGAVVPGGVTLQPVPVEAANQVPALRSYDYAMLQNKLLIVNPSDKKVVDIISKS